MRKKAVLVGLALAAAALCIAILRVAAPAPPRVAIAAPGAPASNDTERAPRVASRELPPGELRAMESTERSTVSADSAGADAQAARLAAPREGGVELKLLGPDGDPVAGAEVLVLEDAGEQELTSFSGLGGIDGFMEKKAGAHVADDRGVLHVGVPKERPTLVLARRGPLWASQRLSPGLKPGASVEVRLLVDVTLRARVVTESGVPVTGATVQLLQRNPWGGWAALTATAEGPDAVAVFRHAQSRIQAADDVTWALALQVLVEEEIAYELDLEQLPTDVVTLVAPALAAVLVQVYDEAGAPFGGEGRVTLGIVLEGQPKRPSPFDHRRRPNVSATLQNGAARFEFVEPGRELEVQVHRSNASVGTRSHGPGPARAGELRTFDVRLGTDHPVARMRAVDADGQPLADTKLHVRTIVETQYSNHGILTEVATDSEGVFHLDLDGDYAAGSTRVLFVLQGAPDEPEASGRVDAGRALPPGVTDFGVVRLAEPPLFVAGRVVDDTGAPVASAELILRIRRAAQKRWSKEHGFQHATNSDGEFEIREEFLGEAFRIGAVSGTRVGSLREFTPGEQGLVLELAPGGAIEGFVLLDEDFPRSEIQLRIVGDVDHLDYDEVTASPDEDGTFRFSSLLPGEHDVTLSFESHMGPFETFAGIPVAGGRTQRDARLDPLDLRGRIHAHRVILVAPEDDGRVQGDVRFARAGAEELEGQCWFYERELWIVTEDAVIDLELTARGHPAERREGVRGEVEIALRTAPTVRLRLAADVELPEPPLYLKAVLAAETMAHNALDWGAPAFDEDRSITVRVPGAGAMKVVWIAERRNSGSSYARNVDVEPAQIVEVSEAPGQEFEVSLTSEQLAKVLAEF